MRFAALLPLFTLFFAALTIAAAQESPAEIVYDPSVCWSGAEASAACLAMMAAHPRPQLDTIPQDRFTLGQFSFWRVGPQAVNLYDAPDGNVIGQIPAGFNFVNAVNTEIDGWIQRLGGEWIARADAAYTRASTFSGYLLPEGWRHPFAIILDKTGIYTSLRPGERGSEQSGYVTRRYDLVNIFARQEDSAGHVWYLIGPQQWLRQEFVAMFAPAEKPASLSARWLAVDLFEQTLIAYEDNKPVFATLVSSGLPEWTTNEGIFEIWARLDRDSMSGATGAPDAYALQDVPWTMYFDGSISLHGTYWHDDFGYRRSHGCVNLSISDARWLYEWTEERQEERTAESATDESATDDSGDLANQVYIFSSGQYADEQALD